MYWNIDYQSRFLQNYFHKMDCWHVSQLNCEKFQKSSYQTSFSSLQHGNSCFWHVHHPHALSCFFFCWLWFRVSSLCINAIVSSIGQRIAPPLQTSGGSSPSGYHEPEHDALRIRLSVVRLLSQHLRACEKIKNNKKTSRRVQCGHELSGVRWCWTTKTLKHVWHQHPQRRYKNHRPIGCLGYICRIVVNSTCARAN